MVETAKDHTLVAKWKANEFNITIQYQYSDGREALPSASYDLEYGTTYEIITPALRGHTPTQTSVSGLVEAQNSVIIVIFDVNSYTLTILYLYATNGNTAAPTYTATYAHGETYSVASPAIDGMVASIATVNGTIDAADVRITVYYAEEEPIISVTVTWGAMTFDLERGEWQPDEHEYTDDTFTPSSTGANSVTVKNEKGSNVSIDVSLSFSPTAEVREADAYFTATNNADGEKITLANIAKNKEKTFYVWLEGRLPNDATGDYVCGTVTVIIRGGQR